MIDPIKQFSSDRTLLGLGLLVAVVSFFYIGYVAFSVERTELQVVVQYTAFGGTNFYRAGWEYLLSFVVMGLVIGVAHVALMIKLYSHERRDSALLVGWLSVALLAIIFIITRSVLQVASLS